MNILPGLQAGQDAIPSLIANSNSLRQEPGDTAPTWWNFYSSEIQEIDHQLKIR